eukprot:TRINITY_DN1313_c0_g1_i1.p1 TRINITY_DN1313_c0_g1~~TRINITY_DN1313_c0_g1_i1.p1  ORF type:complete len:132 (+),score=28.59 TRINITY_DN1313_c0_g1_i1:8-403(+)
MSNNVKELEINETSEFDKVISENESNQNLFVYFRAETDPNTGLSWCPDCVKSDPVVKNVFENAPRGTTLIRCNIKRSEYRQNPSYVYRTHNNIKLKCIPTLIHWQKASSNEKRLEDPHVVDEELRKLLSGN